VSVIDESKVEDVDLSAVDELLKAARRAAHDPDVELAHVLHRLAVASDAEVLEALERLVRDAHSD